VNLGVIVVDASLALKWHLPEAYSDEASTLLQEWRVHRVRLLAPILFTYEVTSALAKRVRFAELTVEQAIARLEAILAGEVRFFRIETHHRRALELAARFGLTAAYDAHYLALAESHQCEFWTADQRLWNSMKRELDWVRWLGEART